jgi:hypothetical protein
MLCLNIYTKTGISAFVLENKHKVGRKNDKIIKVHASFLLTKKFLRFVEESFEL